MAKDGKKKPFVFRFIRTFLIIIIILAAAWTGFSLIGRVKAARVIPDTADLYFQVPNPALLFKDLINHEPLPDILALPELKQALPVFNLIKNSGLQENKFISLAAGRKLEGALVTGYGQTSGENFLAAWDMGLLSPALRFLPLLAGRISIPGLYYVKGGKYSRFEFRTDEKTYYLGPYRNLLIITDNSTLFETVLSGKSGNGASDREIRSKNYDAAFILSPDFLKNLISGDDNPAANTLDFLQFGGPLEAAISIKPRQIDISLSGQISTNQADIEKIISANSTAPDLYSMVPDDTQYLTVLSAGTLGDILNAASAIPGAEIEDPWKKADSASKSLLGMDLNELLLSWTGNEFAVFGMTGRDSPVIVVQVKDEKKRQDVFSRVFNSVFINENNRLNLDGTRLPRIELPAFLNNVLMGMGIKIPSPYYSIYNGYLFISESADSLLAALNGARRNNGLVRTDSWKALAQNGSDISGFTVFYSLDRSLPFFLSGDTPAGTVLRLYRQGLLRLAFENSTAVVNLSVIPGPGRRLEPAPGFPVDPGPGPGNQIYTLGSGKNSAGVILMTAANSALTINPADLSRKKMDLPGNTGKTWAIPAAGITDAAWIVGSQGRVVLADKDLNAMQGFPRVTGLRLSTAPAAWGGKLYLSDFSNDTGSIYVIDNRGTSVKWPASFTAALMSPPSLIDFQNKTYTACYPKEFLGSIWILDDQGKALPGWPVPVSGIAFGSPLLFVYQNRLNAAFVTQAGELSVYDQTGKIRGSFPLQLDKVFYIQPVFDGEFLWLVSSDGELFKISLDGTVLSYQIPDFQVREEGFLTVADVYNDGKKEIFVSGEGNALYGYSQNFQALEGFPLPVWGRPAFADLQGSGKISITGTGMDKLLYSWQFR